MSRSLCNHSTPSCYLWTCWRNIKSIHIIKCIIFQESIFIQVLILDIDSFVTAATESTPCFEYRNVVLVINDPKQKWEETLFSYSRLQVEKSMASVNIRWSNYLLSLHSFQSEHWAWLNEYNPLILFCSLIEKPRNILMWPDRCWESGLILLIACAFDCSSVYASFI